VKGFDFRKRLPETLLKIASPRMAGSKDRKKYFNL
jgi:hypothetical protein